jgi:hypothetical protein
VILTTGTSYVNPTLPGKVVEFSVTVLRSDEFPEPADPPLSSGSTLAVCISLEPGSVVWRVGHALAWPCMLCRRRPHNVGWSGPDVAARLRQLDWPLAGPDSRSTITLLGGALHRLAERVANARLEPVPWIMGRGRGARS